MKRLAMLLMVPLLSACSEVGLLLINTLARFDSYQLTTDVAYGKHDLNKLDIYQPKEPSKATIVFFYGGCWGACDTYTKAYYRFVAQALTTKGYLVVIPDYRLYPQVKFTEIMTDASNAVKWVVKNATKYGASTNETFVMGHSAGGHIAAMLAVNDEYLGQEYYPKLNGFIGLAGAYDFVFDQPYMNILFSEFDYKEVQPSYFVDGTEAPMLLLYGNEDKSVFRRNIDNMVEVVRKKEGKVEPHIYDNIDHVDILTAFSVPYRGKRPIMKDIDQFLRNNL